MNNLNMLHDLLHTEMMNESMYNNIYDGYPKPGGKADVHADEGR